MFVSHSRHKKILEQKIKVTCAPQIGADRFHSTNSTRADFFDRVVTKLQRRADRASISKKFLKSESGKRSTMPRT